ncbi:uncharacterized protein AMSG_03158 [Thecamonas trahens ATCC 50062]|uniref:Uncharacterized protein n=1 Tax=Thecamonas trahens ATCC 50062 TaxID=461836 RepID=A0A0L0D3I5_THETB|nr:hypothetical protein AMSG_03158 [Thecamonas trahens ATCC 50062]KNC46721.1 hypothetical protein AMSG_03158 [Thecamonas trahens ATCC 50062]|eukprot:XP_013760483.1 hypothetical protein AMSG_03158 [Thecamonas trahens ATCC 50062]
MAATTSADELDGLDFDVFAPPAAAAAANELTHRPTVGQTRRASSPVVCDRPTSVQRTLFHSVTVAARDSRSIVPSGLNDYRPRIPLTELAIVRPDRFEHVDIPLGLPVVPLYEDDFVDALRASPAYPSAALAAFDGQDRIAAALNDIVYINVATKNKRNENIVTEPLPLSRLVVEMLLRMNARVRQLNIDGILDSPLALPHWRNPSQRLSGDIDRAARAAGLTSEVFYSRELRGLTTARLAVYQHVRETVLASRDGVFFRLLSSVARPTADSDADASVGLNFDAVATPSTPSTSSRSTRVRRQPDTPGSVARADWNREDKETLADLFAYMAEQNVPPSQHAVRNFLDHNSTLQLIVGLHEKGYDNAQIGNKYRNTRNAIVNKRTQPQTRAAAAALFPKAWLDAIATRTPRRHNH